MKYQPIKHILDDYPKNWPPKKYYIDSRKTTRKQLTEFVKMINGNASEREIDNFLKGNLELISISLSFLHTGHHGAWIIPQQEIKPSTDESGLKPDYIVGGKSSDGFLYCVIDLKGANETIFSEKGNRVYFSNTANMGVFQVLEYINYCSKMQAYLREGLSLTGFREPHGLLIIGRENELQENGRRTELRAAWNRITDSKLSVRTYDALIRSIEEVVLWLEKDGTR